MIEIPQEITKEVKRIVDYLELYNNKDNLSWMKVYKEVLNELNIEKKIISNLLLSSTVKELSNRGYDIIDDPFKLEKYR